MKLAAFDKHFGDKLALRFPALELEPGTICAVVGANGSGKSTLARLIAGVLTPDGGGRVAERGLSVNYLPQRSYPFRLSVRRNLLLAARDASRAEELLHALGLEPLERRGAKSLSGGETARMALARVLMRPCELLILDEPTAAMDMESAAAAEALVRAYRDRTGCAVLLITHDLQQARRLADRALFLHGGELWEQGPAGRVLYRPERPETRQFLDFYAGSAEKLRNAITGNERGPVAK